MTQTKQPPAISAQFIWACSGRAAKALIALGIRAGDGIGSWSPNVPETVVIQCAALRVGAVASHLDPEWDADQASAALKASSAVCVFIRAFFEGRQYPAMMKSIRPQLHDLREVITHGRQPRFARVLPGGWQEFLERGDPVPDTTLTDREDQMGTASVEGPLLSIFSDAGGETGPLLLSEVDIIRHANMHAASGQPFTWVSAPFYRPAALILGCISTLLRGGTIVLPDSGDDAPSILDMLGKAGSASLVTSSETAAELGTYIVEHPEAWTEVERCLIVDRQSCNQLPPVIAHAFGAAVEVIREDWLSAKKTIDPNLAGAQSAPISAERRIQERDADARDIIQPALRD